MEELVVVVAEGCPHCKELIDRLEKSNVRFRVVDATKDVNALKVMRDLGVYKVPLLLAVRKVQDGVEACLLDENGKAKCVREDQL